MCALDPGQRSCQRLSVHRLFFYVGRWSACTTVRLPGSIPGRRVGGRSFSELNVLVRAGGLAGVGVLGRQEVNDACLVSLMNGN